MKKLFFLIAAISMFSCSSDKTEDLETKKLVEVTLGISSDSENLTRLYLGSVEGDMVHAFFEKNDRMYIYDSDIHEFTNEESHDQQTARFKGSWCDDNNAFAAIFPSLLNSTASLSQSGNTYKFNISTTQEVKSLLDGNQITCDANANILLGAKSSKTEPTLFLGSFCCYLYFASHNQTVTITSTKKISGNTVVNTNRKAWYNFDDFKSAISDYTCSSNSITVTGCKVNKRNANYDDSLYEFVVCLAPNDFKAGDLTIGSRTNIGELNIKSGEMVKLGTLD